MRRMIDLVAHDAIWLKPSETGFVCISWLVDNAVTSLHGELGGAAFRRNLLARRTKLIATIIIICFLASS
jgi:hypothetical protein